MSNIYFYFVSKLRQTSAQSEILSEKGVSMIETLVAAGIFAIAMMGLSLSIVELGKSRVKVNSANAAVAIQSYLSASLGIADSYPEATRTQLIAGDSTNLAFTLNYTNFKGEANQTATFNSGNQYTVYFDKDLNTCAGFGDGNCVVIARIGFAADQFVGANAATGAPEDRFVWKAAYHVSTDPNANINIGHFGANLDPATSAAFAASDYKLNLPDVTNKYGMSTNQTTCNIANGEVAVRGVDRDTGQVYCLRKPGIETCPNGRLPRKLVLDLATNQLRLDCFDGIGAASEKINPRSFTCDSDYSLQFVQKSQDFFHWQGYNDTITAPTCVLRSASTETINYAATMPTSNLSGIPGINTNDGSPAGDGEIAQLRYQLCPRPPSGVAYTHDLNVGGIQLVGTTTVDGVCCEVSGCSVATVPVPGSTASDPATSDVVWNAADSDRVDLKFVSKRASWPAACQWPCAAAVPGRKIAAIRIVQNVTCSAITNTKPATVSTP